MIVGDIDQQILLKINAEKLPLFLHECVDELNSSNEVHNLHDVELSNEDYRKGKIAVQKFYQKCVTSGYNDNLKDIPDGVKQALKTCFVIRQNDILHSLAKEALLKNGHTVVENIDWRLKWIMGTSKLASFKKPILQVDLNCRKYLDGKVIPNTVNFETNLDQVDYLISELMKLQSELKDLNV